MEDRFQGAELVEAMTDLSAAPAGSASSRPKPNALAMVDERLSLTKADEVTSVYAARYVSKPELIPATKLVTLASSPAARA